MSLFINSNRPVMGTNNDNISYRRLSMESKLPTTSADGGNGLQRSRSVRASFRLLGARWKAPTVITQPAAEQTAGEVIRINTTSTTSSFTKRFDKQLPHKYKRDHFLKAKHKKLKSNSGRAALTNENWFPTAMPENVPPKAAAILEIPVNVDREQFNRNTSQFLMNGVQFKFLKRSVSLNSDVAVVKDAQKPRTATIRRGSVWANSTLSKDLRMMYLYVVKVGNSNSEIVN